MSESRKVAKRNTKADSAADVSLIKLPAYESGPLSTNQLAGHINYMLENWESMDKETFMKANGTTRSATKYWDTMRGLERLSIERQKLEMQMAALPSGK